MTWIARMLHIVLFQPEIPQNTGNIGRMCALTRSRLHLIHPLGFKITDRHLKRAGMDYWHALDVHHHADLAAFNLIPPVPKMVTMLIFQLALLDWVSRKRFLHRSLKTI